MDWKFLFYFFCKGEFKKVKHKKELNTKSIFLIYSFWYSEDPNERDSKVSLKRLLYAKAKQIKLLSDKKVIYLFQKSISFTRQRPQAYWKCVNSISYRFYLFFKKENCKAFFILFRLIIPEYTSRDITLLLQMYKGDNDTKHQNNFYF